MRKYVAIFRTAFQNSITWRGAFWFYIALNFLPLVGYYYLWTAVFQERASAAGFSYEAILTYAVVATVFSRLTWASPEYGVMENIREGTLTKYLVQPMSYFGYYWSSRLAFRTFGTALTLPFTLAVVYLVRHHLLLPTEAWRWAALLAAIPLAFTLQFLFGMALGLLSFWILEARHFQYFKETALALLGGAILPYAFFPDAVQQILAYLPFRFIASFPIEVYLGRLNVSSIFQSLGAGIVWVAVLYALTRVMWKRGLRRYVAFGH
ncbi:MAG: ABC-2 family transporter protein [Candidatus Kerfeldbacteria bacterium]|nr:ABC-2 family transporter protein [Candidatus Kerfeldbacteria bacterium]